MYRINMKYLDFQKNVIYFGHSFNYFLKIHHQYFKAHQKLLKMWSKIIELEIVNDCPHLSSV